MRGSKFSPAEAVFLMRKSPSLLASFFLAVSLSAAQVPPASPDNQTILKKTVNNVLVDVVVTDNNGQPIRGLTKEQLHITENGAPQTVVFFEEHNDALPSNTPASNAPPLQLPPDVYSNFQSAPTHGPFLVLLMDSLNTPIADQAKVHLAMLQYLRLVPAGVQIAIFALNEHLSMVQGFNADPSVLSAALNQLNARPKQSRLTDDPGHDSYYDGIPDPFTGSSAVAAEATGLKATYVSHEETLRDDARVGPTLDAIRSLAAYLGALPGRKNVIWFSGSFPLSLSGVGHDNAMRSESSRADSSAVSSTRELVSRARGAILPGLASGPAGNTMFNTDMPNTGTLHDSSRTLGQDNDQASSEIDAHSTMNALADQTGGRAFYSSTDLGAAIRSVQQIGSHYYTIAYAPTDTPYDGKFRKIAIKADSPKARPHYRRGYFAEEPASLPSTVRIPSSTDVSFVLLHGAPSSAQILFKLSATPKEGIQPAANSTTMRYRINWIVDLHGIPFTQQTDGSRKGAFSLVLVAYDTSGKLLNQVKDGGDISLDTSLYQKYLASGLQFHQEIDLPSGYVYLRAAIVDESGNRSGSIEIPLNVAARHPSGK